MIPNNQQLLEELQKYLAGLTPRNVWNWITQHWPYALVGVGGAILVTAGLIGTRRRGKAVLLDPEAQASRKAKKNRNIDEESDDTLPLISSDRRHGYSDGAGGAKEIPLEASSMGRDLLGPWHHPDLTERETNNLLNSAGCSGRKGSNGINDHHDLFLALCRSISG